MVIEMTFIKPTPEEVRIYRKTNSSQSTLIIQIMIAILFSCPIVFIWYAGEETALALKLAISLLFLAIDKNFILYAVEIYTRDKNYRKGNYEVYKVGVLDPKRDRKSVV